MQYCLQHKIQHDDKEENMVFYKYKYVPIMATIQYTLVVLVVYSVGLSRCYNIYTLYLLLSN